MKNLIIWAVVELLWFVHLFFPPSLILAKSPRDLKLRSALTVVLGGLIGLGLGGAITDLI